MCLRFNTNTSASIEEEESVCDDVDVTPHRVPSSPGTLTVILGRLGDFHTSPVEQM